MKHRLLRHLSVALTLLLFLGLTAIPALLPSSPGGVYANANEPAGVHIESIEELNTYLKQQDDLPDDLITPDMLAVFGTFRYFTTATDDCDYRYCLTLGSEYVFLSINHNTSVDPIRARITDADIDTTMALLANEKNGLYVSNNVIYDYNSGRLTSIEWISNGIGIQLWASFEKLSHYLPEDHILMKLVSKSPEVRQEAFDMLPDSLGNQDPLNYNPINDFLYHAAAWALPVIGIAACFFFHKYIKKIRKKKLPAP